MNKKKDKYGLLAILALIVMLMLQCNSSRRLKRDLQLEKEKVEREINNRQASEDSLRTIKFDNGTLVSTVRSYEFDIINLKEVERELLKKYEDLTTNYKKLRGINSILKADLDLTEDLLARSEAKQLNDTTFEVSFAKYNLYSEGNSRFISGKNTLFIGEGKPKVTDTEINLDQTIRLRAILDDIDGEGPSLLISTEYPGITISDIENINLINSKLRAKEIDSYVSNSGSLGFGLGLGYGLNYIGEGTFRAGPTLSVGMYWTPKKLRLK